MPDSSFIRCLWSIFQNNSNLKDVSRVWKAQVGIFITSSYEQRCGFSMQFSFHYLFIKWMLFLFLLSCTIDLQLISLDFSIDFGIFTIWLLMHVWIDGQIDG